VLDRDPGHAIRILQNDSAGRVIGVHDEAVRRIAFRKRPQISQSKLLEKPNAGGMDQLAGESPGRARIGFQQEHRGATLGKGNGRSASDWACANHGDVVTCSHRDSPGLNPCA
jgi:hypothetical protein